MLLVLIILVVSSSGSGVGGSVGSSSSSSSGSSGVSCSTSRCFPLMFKSSAPAILTSRCFTLISVTNNQCVRCDTVQCAAALLCGQQQLQGTECRCAAVSADRI